MLSAVDRVRAGGQVEDDRIELKRDWPAVSKARQLAGAANRSAGSPIIWVIGLDEQTGQVHPTTSSDPASLHTAHVALGAQDTHPGHAEHHRCRRVAWSLLILEGLGPSRRQPAATGAPPAPRSGPKTRQPPACRAPHPTARPPLTGLAAVSPARVQPATRQPALQRRPGTRGARPRCLDSRRPCSGLAPVERLRCLSDSRPPCSSLSGALAPVEPGRDALGQPAALQRPQRRPGGRQGGQGAAGSGSCRSASQRLACVRARVSL